MNIIDESETKKKTIKNKTKQNKDNKEQVGRRI